MSRSGPLRTWPRSRRSRNRWRRGDRRGCSFSARGQLAWSRLRPYAALLLVRGDAQGEDHARHPSTATIRIVKRRLMHAALPRRNESTMASDIETKVREKISEQLGVAADEVKPDSSFIEDLGADSLDIVELVMALEEEFNVEISDEDAEKIRTVKDVVNYIEAHKS